MTADRPAIGFGQPVTHPAAANSADPSILKSPAEMLSVIVPTLLDLERTAARLRQMMAREGQRLAKERGVKFIRDEQLKQEFGDATEH